MVGEFSAIYLKSAQILKTSFQNLLPKPELIWLSYCEQQDTNLGVEMWHFYKVFSFFLFKN